jgi:hypothetical protein
MSEPLDNVKITMTLPAVVAKALDNKGWPFAMTGGEWLKQQALIAYMSEAGVAFKLEPVVLATKEAEPELPLVEAKQ